MIDDALGEEQLLLAEVDILEDLPQSELNYLATRSQIVRLGKKESLTLGGPTRHPPSGEWAGASSRARL